MWEDMEQKGVISGDPGTGRSGNLGRSRYDHTLGGTGVKGWSWRHSWERKATGPLAPVYPVTSDGETEAQRWVGGCPASQTSGRGRSQGRYRKEGWEDLIALDSTRTLLPEARCHHSWAPVPSSHPFGAVRL